MLLSYQELVDQVIGNGFITGVPTLDNVNGSSIDITLGSDLLIEEVPPLTCPNCGAEHILPNRKEFKDRSRWLQSNQCIHCGYGGPLHTFVTPVDIEKKQPLRMQKCDCTNGFVLWPGEVCLAHSVEVFHLPQHITAEYRLKSSMGRVFLEHLHAGWCDPGWHGSVLTLEFKNMNNYHPIKLRAGMKCGQVMFYRHIPVPDDASYAVRGQYNEDKTATASKGIK